MLSLHNFIAHKVGPVKKRTQNREEEKTVPDQMRKKKTGKIPVYSLVQDRFVDPGVGDEVVAGEVDCNLTGSALV